MLNNLLQKYSEMFIKNIRHKSLCNDIGININNDQISNNIKYLLNST